MFSFSEIVGHEQIKEHMQAAIRDKNRFMRICSKARKVLEKKRWRGRLLLVCSARVSRQINRARNVCPAARWSPEISRMLSG